MLVFCATAVTPARQLRTTRARIRLFIMASPFNKLDILHNENEAHMRSHCMAQRYYSGITAVQGGPKKATTPEFRGTLLWPVSGMSICGYRWTAFHCCLVGCNCFQPGGVPEAVPYCGLVTGPSDSGHGGGAPPWVEKKKASNKRFDSREKKNDSSFFYRAQKKPQ